MRALFFLSVISMVAGSYPSRADAQPQEANPKGTPKAAAGVPVMRLSGTVLRFDADAVFAALRQTADSGA